MGGDGGCSERLIQLSATMGGGSEISRVVSRWWSSAGRCARPITCAPFAGFYLHQRPKFFARPRWVNYSADLFYSHQPVAGLLPESAKPRSCCLARVGDIFMLPTLSLTLQARKLNRYGTERSFLCPCDHGGCTQHTDTRTQTHTHTDTHPRTRGCGILHGFSFLLNDNYYYFSLSVSLSFKQTNA